VNIARSIRVRQLIRAKKIIICIYFSHSGIGSLVLLPSRETPNRVFIIEKVLANFDEKRAQNLPKNRSKNILLDLDNAIPYRVL
jgi:hypothetical protein